MSVRTCAFCGVRAAHLVHYSMRRYAHDRCLYAARGAEAIRALPEGARGNVTAQLASELGVLDAWLASMGER